MKNLGVRKGGSTCFTLGGGIIVSRGIGKGVGTKSADIIALKNDSPIGSDMILI
jgi:hypothetical protein